MKASVIVTIVLRLFAIQWAAAGVFSLLSIVGLGTSVSLDPNNPMFHWFQMLVLPVCYMLMASATWFCASLISERVVPKSDPELQLFDVGAGDFYGLGVLVMGISTFLSHLTPLLNWIHYLIMNRAGEDLMYGKNGTTMYGVSKELVPCVIGAALALASPKIGARLARKENTEPVKS